MGEESTSSEPPSWLEQGGNGPLQTDRHELFTRFLEMLAAKSILHPARWWLSGVPLRID